MRQFPEVPEFGSLITDHLITEMTHMFTDAYHEGEDPADIEFQYIAPFEEYWAEQLDLAVTYLELTSH